jgi:hypothetical protein
MLIAGISPAYAFDLEPWRQHDAESRTVVDHAEWANLLNQYVIPGQNGIRRFDYGHFSQRSKAALERYLQHLQRVDLPSLNRNEQFAYWVNLYNAATIKVVTDHFPVTSIRNIDISPGLFSKGPWQAKILTVLGQPLSLDNIEHDILRPIWRDPRIHYVVNCASMGCPNLAATPFEGHGLEARLEKSARAYVNHPRGSRVTDGILTASRIYQWYQDDFGGSDAAAIRHLAEYATGDLADALTNADEIDRYEYDWSLNDVDE